MLWEISDSGEVTESNRHRFRRSKLVGGSDTESPFTPLSGSSPEAKSSKTSLDNTDNEDAYTDPAKEVPSIQRGKLRECEVWWA